MMYKNDNGLYSIIPINLDKYKFIFETQNKFSCAIIPAEVDGYLKIDRNAILNALAMSEITVEDAQYLQVCRYNKENKSLCKIVTYNGDVINFITIETGKYMFAEHMRDKSLNPCIPLNYAIQYNAMLNVNKQMMGYANMNGYQCYPNGNGNGNLAYANVGPVMFGQPQPPVDMTNPSNNTNIPGVSINPSSKDVMDYMKVVRNELVYLIEDSKKQIMDNTLDTVMSMKLINGCPESSAHVDLNKAHLNPFDSSYILDSLFIDDSELELFRKDINKLKTPVINMLKGLGCINKFAYSINDSMHMNFYNLFLRLFQIKGTIKVKDLEEILRCYNIYIANIDENRYDISGKDLYKLIERAINVYSDTKKDYINSNDCVIGLMTGLAVSLLETDAINSMDTTNEKAMYSRFVMIAMICGYIKATTDFLYTEMNNAGEYIDPKKMQLYSNKVFRMIVRPIDDRVCLTTPDHTMFLELGFYGINLLRNNSSPVDIDSLWYVKSEAERFAREDSRAYAGMEINVYDENTEVVTHYIIAEDMKLKQIKNPVKLDKRLIENYRNITLKVCDILCSRDISDIANDVPEFAVGFFNLV